MLFRSPECTCSLYRIRFCVGLLLLKRPPSLLLFLPDIIKFRPVFWPDICQLKGCGGLRLSLAVAAAAAYLPFYFEA